MTPPPHAGPDQSCHTCGANDLVTTVRLLPDEGRCGPDEGQNEDDGDDQGPRGTLRLCPACLTQFLLRSRSNGDVVEALLDSGRVVRWDGRDHSPP